MTPCGPPRETTSRGSPAKLTDQSKFIVKPLEKEDRAAFQCGEEALDRYFRERASRDMANGLAAVFIVVPKDNPKTIAGFFTLSSQQIACDILPEQLRKKTGRYKSVGAILLGRMAVAKQFQNQKLGRFVLFAALYEAWKSTQHVSSFALVIDAKTEKVVPFYEKYGVCRLEANRLMLPMKTIEVLVGSSAAKTTTTATAAAPTSPSPAQAGPNPHPGALAPTRAIHSGCC
jgi:GNAT superfamily N-acetyltransferase